MDCGVFFLVDISLCYAYSRKVAKEKAMNLVELQRKRMDKAGLVGIKVGTFAVRGLLPGDPADAHCATLCVKDSAKWDDTGWVLKGEAAYALACSVEHVFLCLDNAVERISDDGDPTAYRTKDSAESVIQLFGLIRPEPEIDWESF